MTIHEETDNATRKLDILAIRIKNALSTLSSTDPNDAKAIEDAANKVYGHIRSMCFGLESIQNIVDGVREEFGDKENITSPAEAEAMEKWKSALYGLLDASIAIEKAKDQTKEKQSKVEAPSREDI